MIKLGPDGRINFMGPMRLAAAREAAERLRDDDPELYDQVAEIEAELAAQYASRTGTPRK